MNLKGFAIAIGMLALVGSCAALGACAVTTAPVMRVDAVAQLESDYFDVSLRPNGLGFNAPSYVRPLNEVEFDSSGFYAVGGIRVEYGYSFDTDNQLASFDFGSFVPLVYYYDLDNRNYSANYFAPAYPCFNLVVDSQSGLIQGGFAGSNSVNSVYAVPVWAYLGLYDGVSYDSTYTHLDYVPAQIGWNYSAVAGNSFSQGLSLMNYCRIAYSGWLRSVFGNEGNVVLLEYVASLALSNQHDFDWDEYNEMLAEERSSAYTRGYNAGLSASTDSTSAIANLFGAIWNVPVNVINGLSPLVIWNTPIVSVLLTFLVLAIIVFIIRKFI